jgi:uncharacterized lipoprotein YajG
MKYLAVVAATMILTGCQTPVTPTAIPAPQKLDCDLIFPAPSRDTLAP